MSFWVDHGRSRCRRRPREGGPASPPVTPPGRPRRSPSSATRPTARLEALGAEVRLLDIERESSEEFARAFAGCRAVVFSAGAGTDGKVERKRTVDLEGSLKSIEACKAAGIKRFVQISALAVDDPIPEDASPVWRAYIGRSARLTRRCEVASSTGHCFGRGG